MRRLIFFIFLGFLMLNSVYEIANAETCTPEDTETQTASLNLEISALYPNPNSGESEWIELTNLGTQTIDLSLYTLEDATGNPWTLSGSLEETIEITGFPFQLNNSNETVTLKTLDGTTVDSFTYASSTKGQILTTDSTGSTSTATTSTTMSDATSTANATTTTTATPTRWPDFSEALPNPEGSDSTQEWIELYNPYGETITLDGLSLDDAEGGSTPYALSGNLAAESYMVINVTDSRITLNNDTDHLRMLGVNGEILWDVIYTDSAEGLSYALINGAYEWTEELTPSTENQGSASATSEESDDENTGDTTDYQNGDVSDSVGISEVFPNPAGPDNEEEWIEITNVSGVAVNLGNWVIDDGEGGSDPYVFPDNTVIEPGATLIIYRTESGIALNNSNETVQLSDYTGEIMDEISYESSVEDQSYSEIEVEEVDGTQASISELANDVFYTWQWVAPSPGEKNPVWKQIKGTVSEWDGTLLTLFDGVSNWTFKTATEKTTDPLLYQIGNTVLVQAESTNGVYAVMYSELVESAGVAETKSFPWSFVLSGTAAAGWIGFEIYKRRKKHQTLAI